ncbi:hypothetical protein [Erythrobacter crassostreae]|uniref:Uncharacterized protein n=1 Tax=Erythrobacter crassostreae TaxID=2828328 RepID=A0A9X1JK64_9SPHN|nr:hypothetical protein [Erythrobacter crassostrea]MBV7258626.1 hypothetical protein [Erythrobacter crassostrea]
MANSDKNFQKRYEDLMRNAGDHRRAISARAIKNERRFRAERKRLKQQRTSVERTDRVQSDLRQHAELLRVEALIKRELAELELKLAATSDSDEQILLRAEITHLQTIKTNLSQRPPRKPPESGIAVPAVPPKGPLPKQGGAEAPLDFGS